MKISQHDIHMIMNRLLVPWGVSIEVTARCNLDCIHCYHPRAEGGELSFDEMTSLLDDLADLGSMDLTFSGGEPFTRNDFLDILDYAVERRGFHVKIFSNLTLLTEEKADRLASYPLNAVETTILGPDSECHDRLARHNRSFRGNGTVDQNACRTECECFRENSRDERQLPPARRAVCSR